MIKLNSILGLLLFGLVFFSCKDPVDPPDPPPPPPAKTGNLEVFIRLNGAAGVYVGGALVNLYKTQSGFNTDSVYMFNYTSTDNPSLNGAMFSKLTFQKYYLKATANMAGKDYEGDTTVLVPINTTTRFHMPIYLK